MFRAIGEASSVRRTDLGGVDDDCAIMCIGFDGSTRVAAGCRNGTVHVWYVPTTGVVELRTLRRLHTGFVKRMMFTNGAQPHQLLVSADSDGTVRVFDLKTGDILAHIFRDVKIQLRECTVMRSAA
jgi:WD40 repeat protein